MCLKNLDIYIWYLCIFKKKIVKWNKLDLLMLPFEFSFDVKCFINFASDVFYSQVKILVKLDFTRFFFVVVKIVGRIITINRLYFAAYGYKFCMLNIQNFSKYAVITLKRAVYRVLCIPKLSCSFPPYINKLNLVWEWFDNWLWHITYSV